MIGLKLYIFRVTELKKPHVTIDVNKTVMVGCKKRTRNGTRDEILTHRAGVRQDE